MSSRLDDRDRRGPARARSFVLGGYSNLVEIGAGGFSRVYRAREERFDRVVAIKVLRVDIDDARTQRLFERECALTGRLTGHPNIVRVFGSGFTESGNPFIVMEYFDRGSLGAKLVRDGRLSVAETLAAGVKLAGALAFAHHRGVLHRDVKPGNVLLSNYGEPALADFGIATVNLNVSLSATLDVFTPLHAPPEVLEAQTPTEQSDIYSLASTLYTLLAGQAPFESGATSGAPMLLRILRDDVPPFDRRDVAPAVLDVLRHGMARSPSDRHLSAMDFGASLRGLQVGLGLSPTTLLDPAGETLPAVAHTAAPMASVPVVQAPSPPESDGIWEKTTATGSRLGALGESAPPQPASPSIVPVQDDVEATFKRSRASVLTVIALCLAFVVVTGLIAGVVSLRNDKKKASPTTSASTRAATCGPDASCPTATPPKPPTNFRIVSADATTVTLAWDDPNNGKFIPVVSYRAETENKQLPFAKGALRGVVSGLVPGMEHCFELSLPFVDATDQQTRRVVAANRPCTSGRGVG